MSRGMMGRASGAGSATNEGAFHLAGHVPALARARKLARTHARRGAALSPAATGEPCNVWHWDTLGPSYRPPAPPFGAAMPHSTQTYWACWPPFSPTSLGPEPGILYHGTPNNERQLP